ncbi:MAG: UPF0149 family protein [Chromatocurvus sp.]
MFDLRPGDNSDLPDFDELANHLFDQGIQSSPSELHGCLAGLLGGGAGREASAGLAGLGKALAIDVHGELADGLQQMYARTAASAESEKLHFHPLLPGDETELAQRTQALADWCRGFLSGFAQARVTSGLTEAGVAADSAEALRDFAAIAQADAEDDDPDDAEHAYAELVEYLRVAAMNVIADSQQQVTDAGMTADRTLH